MTPEASVTSEAGGTGGELHAERRRRGRRLRREIRMSGVYNREDEGGSYDWVRI